MRCALYQWWISRAADADQSPGGFVERHTARCADCRRFRNAAANMASQLRRNAGAWREAALLPTDAVRETGEVMRRPTARPTARPVSRERTPRKWRGAVAMLTTCALALGIGIWAMQDGVTPRQQAGQVALAPPDNPDTPPPPDARVATLHDVLPQATGILDADLGGMFSRATTALDARLSATYDQTAALPQVRLNEVLTQTTASVQAPLHDEINDLIRDTRAAGTYLLACLPLELRPPTSGGGETFDSLPSTP